MIDNPLQMNDWGIKKFLIVCGVFQVALLILAGLTVIGITVPVLPQIVGFIYLTFLPGLIILRIMRMHRQGTIITLLYTVGLSLTFNMFLGFLINLIYPLVGIVHPISPVPLFVTWAILLGLLCLFAFLRDRDYSYPGELELAKLPASALFFVLLPLLAVLGSQVVNYYDSNIVLLVLIGLIALIAILIITTKIIPPDMYPLAVFCIALALLWHSSLVSTHLTGWDIFDEYYFYRQVVLNGSWDLTLNYAYNGMLSVTILPAVCTFIMNMPGEAFFKIVYPLYYALVPMALYTVYDRQLGSKRAFAGVFFFMSIYVFSLTMTTLARQMIAELFFVLLIILIVEKELTAKQKVLFILFGASLVVSHYSLSYIFMALMLVSVIILYSLKERKSQVTIFSFILFSVICLFWYIYISSAAPFNSILGIFQKVYQHAFTGIFDMFNTETTFVFTQSSPNVIHLINRIVYYLMLFFTAIGAFRLLPGRNKNFSLEYLAFAVGSYALLAVSMVVPLFSQSLSVQRIFHNSIIVLAPFTILGIEDTLKVLSRVSNLIKQTVLPAVTQISVSLLLALFFLFNIGFVFELVQDPWVDSLPLNLGHVTRDNRDIVIQSKIALRNICPTEQEISSAIWLKNYKENELPVYATHFDIRVPSLEAYGLIPVQKTESILLSNPNSGIGHGYIYLGYVNVLYGYGGTSAELLKGNTYKTQIWDIKELDPALGSSLKIYDNTASSIYLSP
jgi:uncharacterized membrane protein